MGAAILFLGPPVLALAGPATVLLWAKPRDAGFAGCTLLALAAGWAHVAGGVGALLILAAWTLLFVAFAASLRAARVPRGPAMGAAGLAALALLSTIFWLGPVGDFARASGVAGVRVGAWTKRALDVHPYVAASRFVPDSDPLRKSWMYSHSSLAEYPYVPAPWSQTAAAYLVLAASLCAPGTVAALVRRARGR